MYQAHGLLLPESDFSMDVAAMKLAARFPAFTVSQEASVIRLSSGDWEIHLTLRQGPDVLAESQEVARHIGGAVDELGISRCDRRVEVASDISDPEMDHFNHYLQVLEVLQTFRGLIAVDPKEPSLM